MNTFNMERLVRMLTYKRPYNNGQGTGAKEFTADFIMPVARAHAHFVDTLGNLVIDLRTSPEHRTMFTAHTDSVHGTEGRQKVHFDTKSRVLFTPDGECLGADDASGVALMLHMIEAEVPAAYVFFVGEEVGCVGSQFMVKDNPEFFKDFDRAIAFDRRSTFNVITHQLTGRCCSEKFAEALSSALNNDELMYAPDSTGIYTDTAHLIHLIPECSNLSVGYMHEHSSKETQDVDHITALAKQVVKIDWDALPTERDVNEVEEYFSLYEGDEYIEDVDYSYPFWEMVMDSSGSALRGASDYYFHEDVAFAVEMGTGQQASYIAKFLQKAGINQEALEILHTNIKCGASAYEECNRYYQAVVDNKGE